ncbi:phage tail assembly chaperone [Achromobacter denitrificans]|uniref:phage tail assembly chaperone n=1 Tax=Achromobacter denitrificans TaxID=32002 RepID=UPI0023E7EB16|nr:phage tail assembly chaperone [Achromobacter denitrificans]MBV2160247.1 phage tail assembly chaperone [Achromobacter denitrificans]MDF3850674.1 phage tail assembly chaperone [Achromobacter denitrificans]
MATKTKFTLNPKPTFKKKVPLPIPGDGFEDVEFTFKHRTRDEFKEFLDGLKDRVDDVELLMDIVSGWVLEDPFDAENVGRLVQGYPGSARAVLGTYIDELSKAREGN